MLNAAKKIKKKLIRFILGLSAVRYGEGEKKKIKLNLCLTCFVAFEVYRTHIGTQAKKISFHSNPSFALLNPFTI